MNAYILAIDCYLPSQVVKTRDMIAETQPERLGFSDTLIDDVMGIREVRHASYREKPSPFNFWGCWLHALTQKSQSNYRWLLLIRLLYSSLINRLYQAVFN